MAAASFARQGDYLQERWGQQLRVAQIDFGGTDQLGRYHNHMGRH
jgi:hypothetical protein